jgi:predicted nucleotidyltransferase
MADRVANPIAIAYHYASMLRHALDDRTDDGTIGIKKLCYARRAGLCVRWVMEHETMPPTAFADVRRGLDLGREVDDAIDHLLAIKENAREKERTIPAAVLLPLIEDCLGKLDRHAWRKPDNDIASARADLERIFRSYVSA